MNKYIKNNFSEASIMKKYTKLIKKLKSMKILIINTGVGNIDSIKKYLK